MIIWRTHHGWVRQEKIWKMEILRLAKNHQIQGIREKNSLTFPWLLRNFTKFPWLFQVFPEKQPLFKVFQVFPDCWEPCLRGFRKMCQSDTNLFKVHSLFFGEIMYLNIFGVSDSFVTFVLYLAHLFWTDFRCVQFDVWYCFTKVPNERQKMLVGEWFRRGL